jgi:hypothetical protein
VTSAFWKAEKYNTAVVRMEIDSRGVCEQGFEATHKSGVRKKIQTIFTFCQRIKRNQTDGILAKEMS